MKRLNIKIYSFHYESYSLDIYIERDKDSVPYQQTETSDRCKWQEKHQKEAILQDDQQA